MVSWFERRHAKGLRAGFSQLETVGESRRNLSCTDITNFMTSVHKKENGQFHFSVELHDNIEVRVD